MAAKRHRVGKAKRRLVPGFIQVEELRPGDILTRDHDGKSYDVMIVAPSRPTEDRFGREMLSFRARILPGRDAGSRAGEEGNITFGPGGVVREPRRGVQ